MPYNCVKLKSEPGFLARTSNISCVFCLIIFVSSSGTCFCDRWNRCSHLFRERFLYKPIL